VVQALCSLAGVVEVEARKRQQLRTVRCSNTLLKLENDVAALTHKRARLVATLRDARTPEMDEALDDLVKRAIDLATHDHALADAHHVAAFRKRLDAINKPTPHHGLPGASGKTRPRAATTTKGRRVVSSAAKSLQDDDDLQKSLTVDAVSLSSGSSRDHRR